MEALVVQNPWWRLCRVLVASSTVYGQTGGIGEHAHSLNVDGMVQQTASEV